MINVDKEANDRHGIREMNAELKAESEAAQAMMVELVNQVKSIPSEQFESLVLIAKMKGEDSPLIAMAGPVSDILRGVMRLMKEAEERFS